MSRLIVLDSGPVGLITHPRNTPQTEPCKRWLQALLAAGERVALPEIIDYEIRRELLRAGKRRGLNNLDRLSSVIEYLPITTTTMQLAADLWAALRRRGEPTADLQALDIDVILAAQARLAGNVSTTVVVATTNVSHLARLVPAEHWASLQA